ncbi:MAG: cyanophycin synthetase, partial [Dehalococcoidia bacterium]
LRPRVTAITSISLDHTEVLGDSLAQIAGEKAAIVKPGVPVVCAPQPPEALEVVRRTAADHGSQLTLVGEDVTWQALQADLTGQRLAVRSGRGARELWLPLLGPVQRENAATAVALVEALADQGVAIPPDAVRRGLERVVWPGRMEVLSRRPLMVADGAHNPYSMGRLVEALREALVFDRVVAVFGAGRSKDLGRMIGELTRLERAQVVATRSRHPKAAAPGEIARRAAAHGIEALEAEDTAAALARAGELAGPDDLILATGSLFVAAEAREAVLGIEPEIYAGVALV